MKPNPGNGHAARAVRTIFHLDLDSFFVSAERLQNPALIGKPVAVGGTGPRSVLSSASYEARKFGVRSAMPTAQAKRLCPQLIVVRGTYGLYSKLSRQVFDIVEQYSPIVERVSVDEAYIDMTGTEGLFGPPIECAKRMRAEVREKVKLPASIGIAANRTVAKIATDQAKPDGQLWVKPGEEAAFLAPLPVQVIPGVGPQTQKWLNDHGFFRIRDLQNANPQQLENALGEYGRKLWERAHGHGSLQFFREAKNPSISREQTFSKDVWDPARVDELLWEMCEELGEELRQEDKYASTVKLKLRYPPFETVVRSRVLEQPTRLDRELFAAAHALCIEHWDASRALRLIGVGFSVGEAGESQLGLFEDTTVKERWSKLDALKDKIRQKFGPESLSVGRVKRPES